MASGDTLLTFHPYQNTPPTSNFATFDLRNVHPVLAFDDTNNESAVFSAIMPRIYAGSGLTINIHYAMTAATSGNIDWDVDLERIGDGQQDIDSDGFVGANSTDNTTVDGTSGNVDIVAVTFDDGADMDSIAVGEAMALRTRSGTNSSLF